MGATSGGCDEAVRKGGLGIKEEGRGRGRGREGGGCFFGRFAQSRLLLYLFGFFFLTVSNDACIFSQVMHF